MTDRNALAQQIASILDYPSIYMGAPSNRSLRYAEKIVGLLDEHIAAARAEALGEAKNEAQRIMRLAADSGSTGAVVGAKCVRDAIRALMDPPT
jgi:hypothetical protein